MVLHLLFQQGPRAESTTDITGQRDVRWARVDGLIVMNTQEELCQAMIELQTDDFIKHR
jgi:hypothetical protein